MKYRFYSDPHLCAFYPRNTALRDNTCRVTAFGTNFSSTRGSDIVLRFRYNGKEDEGQTIAVEGRVETSTSLSFVLPDLPKEGVYGVELTLNNQDYTENHRTFRVYNVPLLRSVSPMTVPLKMPTEITVLLDQIPETGLVDIKFKVIKEWAGRTKVLEEKFTLLRYFSQVVVIAVVGVVVVALVVVVVVLVVVVVAVVVVVLLFVVVVLLPGSSTSSCCSSSSPR